MIDEYRILWPVISRHILFRILMNELKGRFGFCEKTVNPKNATRRPGLSAVRHPKSPKPRMMGINHTSAVMPDNYVCAPCCRPSRTAPCSRAELTPLAPAIHGVALTSATVYRGLRVRLKVPNAGRSQRLAGEQGYSFSERGASRPEMGPLFPILTGRLAPFRYK
jgi:hypothetical protein